jgi:hypothetical protein
MAIDWRKRREELAGEFVRWTTPGQVVEGRVVAIEEGSFPDGRPCINVSVETADGVVKMSDGPVRLASGLADAAPEVGDVLRVEYLGESSTTTPGRSPAKLFRVEVTAKAQPVDVGDLA